MFDRKKINELLSESDADESVKKIIGDYLSKMSDSDIAKISAAVENEDAAKKILHSAKAEEILKKFSKGEK